MTPDLRTLRASLGLTQGQACRLLDVERRVWSRWECGHASTPRGVWLLLGLLAAMPEAMAWVRRQEL